MYRLNVAQSGLAAEAEGDKELTLLGKVAVRPGTRYRPFVMLPRGNVSLTCCALSDIGVLSFRFSVAYELLNTKQGSLVLATSMALSQ